MGILREASAAAALEPADVKGKVGAFYTSFMDEARIEALGAKPIAPELDAIRAADPRGAGRPDGPHGARSRPRSASASTST